MTFSSPRSYGSDPTPSAKSAANEVGDNVSALREDIASLAASVKRLAAEQIGTSVEDAQDMAMEKVGDLEAAIRRNPSQSALIAAGVGFVVGLVLVR
jgi:ElaB/YqjD/DUF883 family membrane-anchored ribosome-binding protein